MNNSNITTVIVDVCATKSSTDLWLVGLFVISIFTAVQFALYQLSSLNSLTLSSIMFTAGDKSKENHPLVDPTDKKYEELSTTMQTEAL
jgi:hypothetical protein